MNLKSCKSILLVVFFIFSGWSHAQLVTPFKERYKANVKGDMTIIANSILNRIDRKNSTNMPFNEKSFETPSNDEMDMEYIDIDNVEETFSSSSAALFLKKEETKKIIYAGLYWSATYKFESGYKKGEDKFVAFDKERHAFDEILIKFPTKNDYQPIKGEVIFDGIKDKNFKEVAPYAVYADITDYVKELENPFGFYTVANVKATQGTLIGGSAAGWTILFVYEDLSMSEKYITSHDGFGGASSNSIDIFFKNFETKAEGDVVVKLACSALEGDLNVDGDLLMFSSSTNPSLSNIKTLTRKYSNFFDSTITIEDEDFRYRIPDSKNTLGYDALLTTLYNPKNSKIGNKATDARIRFKSSGDVFYLFHCALTLEVKPSPIQFDEPADTTKLVYEDKKFKLIDKKTNKEIVAKAEEVTMPAPTAVKEVIQPAEKPLATQTKTVEKPTPLPSKETIVPIKASQPTKKEAETKVVQVPQPKKTTDKPKPMVEPFSKSVQILNNIDVPKGYYLVANVFNERVNAAKFMMRLRDEGLNPNYFTNPENNFMYVYLDFVNSREAAEALQQNKLNNTFTEELWILIVNIEK
ncbi:hypothetical protein [Flavobacterium sp.]|uniref:SPOR domain-containing protein n=1 Tax=Flavobacterium sp. TaxID=239 RepID=UPI002621044C|nr:hypothetical protein [Flavobacterium sp.]MDD2984876.1 hypothetical protein [Flavobacterium sp.]